MQGLKWEQPKNVGTKLCFSPTINGEKGWFLHTLFTLQVGMIYFCDKLSVYPLSLLQAMYKKTQICHTLWVQSTNIIQNKITQKVMGNKELAVKLRELFFFFLSYSSLKYGVMSVSHPIPIMLVHVGNNRNSWDTPMHNMLNYQLIKGASKSIFSPSTVIKS